MTLWRVYRSPEHYVLWTLWRVYRSPEHYVLWHSNVCAILHVTLFTLAASEFAEVVTVVYWHLSGCVWCSTCKHGSPQDFFQGWAWRGSVGQKSPTGSRGSSLVGSSGKAPKNWRYFLKMMYKYFVYWGFRQHLQPKNTSTFPRGSSASRPSPTLAHACRYPCLLAYSTDT